MVLNVLAEAAFAPNTVEIIAAIGGSVGALCAIASVILQIQQNRIFLRQNEIMAKETAISPYSQSRAPILWPPIVTAALSLLTWSAVLYAKSDLRDSGFILIIILLAMIVILIWPLTVFLRGRFTTEEKLPDIPWPFEGPTEELINDMSPNRLSVKRINGVYELGDRDRITTNRLFSPTVAFRLLAKTSFYELRFGYIEKEMIFNWPGSEEFRIGEAPAVKEADKGPFDKKHVGGAGTIPTNKWVRIDVIATNDSFRILVEGHQRFFGEADMSKFKDSFSVFTCGQNKVHVKSLLVGKPA